MEESPQLTTAPIFSRSPLERIFSSDTTRRSQETETLSRSPSERKQSAMIIFTAQDVKTECRWIQRTGGMLKPNLLFLESLRMKVRRKQKIIISIIVQGLILVLRISLI